jgi:hypothetical protein
MTIPIPKHKIREENKSTKQSSPYVTTSFLLNVLTKKCGEGRRGDKRQEGYRHVLDICNFAGFLKLKSAC